MICAVAQANPPGDLPDQIADKIEKALGKAFRPGAVHIVADLLRTRNGKIMRRAIRNVLRQLDPGDISAIENPEAISPLKALARQ